MQRPDTLAIIDFLARRYEIDSQDPTSPDAEINVEHSDGPERREKLQRLKRMHRYVASVDG